MFLFRKPKGEPIEAVIKFTHQSARELVLSMLEVIQWSSEMDESLLRAIHITEGTEGMEDGEELIVVGSRSGDK